MPHFGWRTTLPIRQGVIGASSTLFFGLAVTAGFLLIGVVAYGYVHPRPEQRTSVTTLLGLLGFALIASPNFTSISIRSDEGGLELSLIREMQARQLEAITSLSGGAPSLSGRPPAAEVEPVRSSPQPLRRSRASATASGASSAPLPAPPSRPATHPPPSETPLSDDDKKRIFGAFSRGELDLSRLSNRELLVLNEQVTARASLPAGALPLDREVGSSPGSQ